MKFVILSSFVFLSSSAYAMQKQGSGGTGHIYKYRNDSIVGNVPKSLFSQNPSGIDATPSILSDFQPVSGAQSIISVNRNNVKKSTVHKYIPNPVIGPYSLFPSGILSCDTFSCIKSLLARKLISFEESKIIFNNILLKSQRFYQKLSHVVTTPSDLNVLEGYFSPIDAMTVAFKARLLNPQSSQAILWKNFQDAADNLAKQTQGSKRVAAIGKVEDAIVAIYDGYVESLLRKYHRGQITFPSSKHPYVLYDQDFSRNIIKNYFVARPNENVPRMPVQNATLSEMQNLSIVNRSGVDNRSVLNRSVFRGNQSQITNAVQQYADPVFLVLSFMDELKNALSYISKNFAKKSERVILLNEALCNFRGATTPNKWITRDPAFAEKLAELFGLQQQPNRPPTPKDFLMTLLNAIYKEESQKGCHKTLSSLFNTTFKQKSTCAACGATFQNTESMPCFYFDLNKFKNWRANVVDVVGGLTTEKTENDSHSDSDGRSCNASLTRSVSDVVLSKYIVVSLTNSVDSDRNDGGFIPNYSNVLLVNSQKMRFVGCILSGGDAGNFVVRVKSGDKVVEIDRQAVRDLSADEIEAIQRKEGVFIYEVFA